MIGTIDINMDDVATTPTLPTLQKHHDGYSWTSYWRDDRGALRTKRLGKESDVSKRQAKAIYDNWLQSEWNVKAHVQNPDSDPARFTAKMLAEAYREYALKTFTKHGRITSHVVNVNYAMDDMENAWGNRPLVEIEAHELVNLRDGIIFNADGEPRALSTVNGRLSIVKAALVWGSTEKNLFPASKALELCMVKPLRVGRCAALAPTEVRPVALGVVQATQAKMPAVLRDMTEVGRVSGMRPGELCIMRACDLDMRDKKVWIYTPSEHKTEHKGKERKVAIGPKAQAVIGQYLNRPTTAYLFSPREAHAQRLELRRSARKTPLYPSHDQRRTYEPSGAVGDCYCTETYRRAIHYACKLAKVEDWNPNQLRHLWGTEVREKFNLEAAAAGMGNTVEVAEVYAERSMATAKNVARKVG